LRDRVESFLGGDLDLDDLNRRSRVILVARHFEPALFSMGAWLARSGIAFRCIEYTPFEVREERFLAFSVAFDQAPESLFPVAFESQVRDKAYFWHNIGEPTDAWWQELKKRGEITASFQNQPGDEGERLLKSYVAGDTVVAYAKGFGAVGWGIVEHPSSYKLISLGDPADILAGRHLHRLGIKWGAVAPTLRHGIPADEVRNRFGIFHPISTSVRIAEDKGGRLVEALREMVAAV
jgi:hypothetical protein